ncbi:MAG: late control gene D protein [Bacteriophage sp.]|nr:MAG: late control gene D protein [Bacteriophage sp.]
MYHQSTAEFGNLVQQDSRTFKCLLTYDKVSITKVKSIKLTGGSEAEDDFSLGSTMSQYIEVTIPAGNILIEGKEILLQIGMDVNGLTEYIPMGYFTVGKPKKADDQITFTAYDRMMHTERTFFMDGTTTNTVAVLKKIAEITGIPVVTSGLTAISMKVPKGYSCREALSYVAQLHGAFAVCNRRGQIELHTYVDSDYKVKPNRYWGNFEHNDYVFDVSKFVCFTGQDKNGKSISISSGSGARSVSFSNPFMTQTVLNNILASFKSFSYMPGTLKMMGDPCLDPWDILTVADLSGNTYKVPIMKLEWEFDGGLMYSVEAVGLSEEETNADYKGPQTKEMERYYAQLVMIDQAMINKLDVDTANITYATIKNLNVVEENVQKINGEVGNFKELTAANFTAANAKIDVLDGNYANIKTLLSGGAGIGDLQNIHLTSQNAVIDSALIRSAVMQTVSVADLLAGTISTNKFLIASDDGGIRIQGATQQWSDTDGTVRMQAGRDASGDFTFSLFDKTGKGILIDATGVKPDAIADGLIVNKMVSDNAAIAGSKLDIPSVVSAINDSSQSIKSSRIWFDEQNQSLNQTYSQLNQNVTEIRSTASSAASKADVANETAGAASKTAQQALSVLSGISTLDAIGAALNNDAHVVHTNTDGSGGDYSDCSSKMTVYLGDTDVSDDSIFTVTVSAGVTGHWDETSRTYYVTAMSADNGFVDIDALYGTGDRYLTTRKGLRLTTRSGKYILVQSGGAHIRKRFSISKAKDGKIGLSYDLHSSTLAVRKQKDGKTLIPASITFSATQNDTGLVRSYSGRYSIQETEDGTTYTLKYVSTADEIQKIYTPSNVNVKAVRCTLLSAGGVSELDTQTVIILADAEGLTDDIKEAQKTADQAKEAIVVTNQNVANIETSMEGFRTELSETTTDLHGLTDNTLLYNVKYHDNNDGTTTLNAVVYKNGTDVTETYPARWFAWSGKTESGETYLGYGYSITVNNSDYEFGGVCVGTFITYDTLNLTTRAGKQLTTRAGRHITIWREK